MKIFKYYIINIIQLIFLIVFFINNNLKYISSIPIIISTIFIISLRIYLVRKNIIESERENFKKNINKKKIIRVFTILFYLIVFSYLYVSLSNLNKYENLDIKILLIGCIFASIEETIRINNIVREI